MLEIKLVNYYLKKHWFLLMLMIIFQIFTLTFFIIVLNIFDKKNVNIVNSKDVVDIIKNYDIFFLGMFLFPLIKKIIGENYFYKNYLLRTKNNFKSNLIVIFYFFCICFLIILIRKITFYHIEYSIVQRDGLDERIPDVYITLFGDLHLIVSSLLLGKIISSLPIKKIYLLYIFLTVMLLFLFGFFTFFGGGILYFKLTPKQSTDVASLQTLQAIYYVKTFLVFTPLAASFILNDTGGLGLNFNNLFNFDNFYKEKYPLGESVELSYTLAIWLIVSFFIYIIMIIIFSSINKRKIIKLQNLINIFIKQKCFNNI